MSALLKNQIAKQLARFTKNLSPNKISLKFLKGEGELHNLELNEKILTELLELPPWLRLTKAVCNKISAKIHWTRLKTDPICLYLDCVEVSMEAATDMVLSSAPQASPHQTSQIPAKDRQPTKYGFVEKVVDGMFVQINSVIVSFKSTSFLATVNLSRLIIQSTSHEWEPADLRMTRIKDDIKRQVLTFKQITWSTLRIDANALYNHQTCYQTNSPLRVITNNSSLNITIKKCTEDCSVLSAQLELFLDEILWVLNQSQLQALAGFLNSIIAVFDKTKTTKEPEPSPQPAGQAAQSEAHYSRSNMQGSSDKTSSNPLFQKFDVTETSYHLRTGRIDLHLCDDSSLTEQSKNSTANENSGGAMQIQINKLALDHYPFHLAGTSRTGWPCHNEASLQRAYWVKQLLNTFRTCLRNKSKPSQAPLVHLQQSTQGSKTQVHLQQSHSAPASPRQARKAPQQHQGAHSLSNPQKPPVFMYESCFVIRCEEFLIQPVTMSDSRGSSVPFFSSDKKALFLPSDMPAFQLDYTQYYYPAGVKFTVPAPNLFVQLNPVQLTLDPATCVWFNQFMHSILCGAFSAEGLAQPPLDQSPSHIDIRVEALMPKVNIPCPSDPNAFYKEFRPQGLQLQMSQVFITNSRTGTNSTQSDLLMVLQEFQASKLYTDLSMFPNNLDDFMPLPNVAWVNDSSVVDEASMERNISGIQENGQDSKQLSQVWCIFAEQMWLDFIGVTSANGRPVPFVDAIPLHLWICTPLAGGDANMTEGSARAVNRGSFEKNLPISFNSPPNVARQTFSRRKVLEPLTAGSTLKTQTNSSLYNSISSPNLHQKTELSKGEQQNHNRGLLEGSEFYARCFDRDCNSLPASPRRFLAKKKLEETQEESQPIKKPLCQVTSCSSVTSTNSSSSLPSVPDSENSQEDYIMVEKEISEPPPAYEENLPGINIPNGHCVRDTPETVLFDEKPPPYEAPLHTGEGPCNVNSLNMYQNCNGALPAYSTVPQDNKGLKHINGPPNSLLSEAPTEEAPPLSKKAPLPRGTIQYFTDNEENQMMKSNCSQVADMTVLVAFHDTVKLQLDHFQFVCLLRMQEMLTKLMEDIDRDRSKFDVKRVENQATKDPVVSCHLLLKGAEVNVVLPPSPESSQSVGVCHGNTSTVSSFQDTGIVSDNGSETSGANGLTPDSLDIDGDKVSELPEDNSQNCEIEGRNSEFRMNADSSPISSSSSRSDSAHVSDVLNVQNDALNVQNDALGRVSVASDVSSEVWMLGMESGQSSHAEQGSRRNSEGSCTSMGRDSSLSLTDNKIVKTQKCQKVSIVTVKGSNIQLGVQMKGEDLAVKIAVQKVDLAETGNVNFEKFINRKSTKTNCTSVGTPIPEIDSREPMGAIRLDFGPMASKLDPVAPERGFAHIKLSEIVASLLISNAESLGDFIEDEVIIPPMPFVVELRNSEVTIINDAPPRLLSAPPAIPINLGIQSVTVRRDESGTISVNGMQTSGGSESQCFRQSSSEPSLTNDLTSENYRLAERLAVTQTALRSVQEEREALLKTIERLRTELAISNREQEQIQEKLLLLTYPRGSSPRKGYR